MKKWLLLVPVLLVMCVSCAHGEEKPLFGAWTPWSETAPRQTDSIEIEEKTETVRDEISHWHYKRYIYYDSRFEAWFSTYTDELEDGVAEDGYGYWEEKTTDEPLPVLYPEEAAVVYEGGWYQETKDSDTVSREVTLYRSRAVKNTGCVFSVHEHVINVNEYRDLTLRWNGKKHAVSFESSDPTVAEVDERGTLHGVGKGECVVIVRMDGVIADTCRVEACRKGFVVEDGLYVLSLREGALAIGSGDDTPAVGDVPTLAAGVKRNNNRVRVENTDENAFLLRSPFSEDLAYCRTEDGGVSLQKAEKDKKTKKYPKIFQWKAMECADGAIRLYAKGAPDTVLAFDGVTLGSAAGLADAKVAEATQRFTLDKKIESVFDYIPAMPVPTNGTSYVTGEFGVQRTEAHMHEGIDIGSFGKRVECYSILPGKVIKIRTGCTHDYGKNYLINGRYTDPCGNTAGNYVYIDHGDGIVSVYMHLSKVLVHVGDRVTAGQQIGVTGSTGGSSGVHLHFAIQYDGKFVNPRDYLEFPELGLLIR